jgi:RNase adaptor protein for sRNA GlmZ degradation
MLHINIYSFGFHRSGIPADPHGNGGGFVFDCRSIPNPGREAEYRHMNGCDPEIQAFLESLTETAEILHHALALIEKSAHSYVARGYSQLQVAFGCTGGQHRSVYCSEQAARLLREQGFSVSLEHTEREYWP